MIAAMHSLPVKSGDTILLVHGTFSHDAGWFRSDGTLPKTLCREFPDCRVEYFQWSGKNTHSARVTAGEELALFIKQLQHDRPGSIVHLVTHSHGGMVALYMYNDGSISSHIGSIAFFGTPFLECKKRNLSNNLAQASASFRMIIRSTVPLVGLFLIFSGNGLGILIGLPLLFSAVALVTTKSDRPVEPLFQDFGLFDGVKTRIDNWRKRNFDKLSFDRPQCPVYIGRVSGDEALLLLNTADRLSGFPWFLNSLVKSRARHIFYIATISALLSNAYLLIENYVMRDGLESSLSAPEWLSPVESTLGALGALGMLICFLWAVLYVLIYYLAIINSVSMRSTSATFGGEGLLFAIALRVRPVGIPTWSLREFDNLAQFEGKGSVKSYRHCFFYEDAKVIADLTNWLRRDLGTRTPAR